MAIELTAKAELLSQKTNIQQQIVLQIDGIDTIYGAVHVIKRLEYGDDGAEYGIGLVYGGGLQDPNSKDYISLKGTTKNITQQLRQDKGGSGSVSSVTIELVDKNQFVSKEFTSTEILSKKANVYLMFQGSLFPQDAIKIFSGNISSRNYGSGLVKIKVDHPENLKRQELYQVIDTELTASVTDVQTIIPIKTVAGLVPGTSELRTFVRVNDEIIEYTGINNFDLVGCTRGSLLTTAAAHDSGDSVTSFYELSGSPVPLALKLMLSGRGMAGAEFVAAINQVSLLENIQNAVFFYEYNIQEKLGLVVGDTVTISDSANNNFTNRPIVSFHQNVDGSYFVVGGAEDLVTELASETNIPTIAWKSKYDVSLEGGKLAPSEVDIAGHEDLEDLLGSSFPDYRFYLKESMNLKEFLEKEIYFPVGLYQVPRKGRASVGATLPPVAVAQSKTIGSDQVVNASKIEINRSTNENFYNAIVYKYEVDVLEDKFLAGNITTAEDSFNQINVGVNPLRIEAKGFRNDEATTNFIESQARRFADRYQFAAESITVDVNYKTGFNIDIADTVIFGDAGLQIVDKTKNSRDFEARIMEVANKSLSMTNGRIRLKLIDTAFGTNVRYATMSPSSFVQGGTTTLLKVADEAERAKWVQYIGNTLLIHSEDYSFQENVTLVTVSNDGLVIDTLSTTPIIGHVIDIAFYDEAEEYLKRLHAYMSPSDQVITGVSTTQFTVSDASNYFIDGEVELHKEDYSVVTDIVAITNIVGTTITVEDMGVTPDNTYQIDFIGFSSDNGNSYAYL